MTFARRDEAIATRPARWSRAVALTAAGAASLALTLDPYVLSDVSSARVHEGMPLLMLGVSGAFAYGLGFRPAQPILRALLHPAVASVLFGAGAALLALH
jgi:predicted membrane protein